MDGMTITGATLTPQLCSDIMKRAVGAGYTYRFCYWAELLSTVDGPRSAGIVYRAIKIRELEEDGTRSSRTFTATHSAIEQAVSAMLKDPKGTHCEGLIPQLMSENGLDGPLADAIIQVACFGEIKYS